MATSSTESLVGGLQQIPTIFSKSSVVVKTVCILVCIFYFLSFLVNITAFQEALTVTPGLIFPPSFRIWTLFTHPFVEVHLWFVIIDIAFILVAGKLIEPLFGALEMLIFFCVVNTGAALLSSVIYLFMYLTVFNTALLFASYLHGLAGYVAGVSVVLKQMMGDQDLIGKGSLKLKIKDLPLLILSLSAILRVLGLIPGTSLSMCASGLFVSWIYLRFFQRQSGTKGDMSDTFRFATFFPEVMQPPVAIVSNTVYSFLVRIKICKKQIRKYDVGAPSPININLPGSDPADAERRRQIALKALNERLSAVEEQTAWPSMDEQPSTPVETTMHLLPGDSAKDSGKEVGSSSNGNSTTVNMDGAGETVES
ncbi:transmembrane protein 115-like [Acanthaster planci]|uniref:Transmembrane protein 115-like n=1 Tax=Acanthaster planci TaxID=133434 RepID=A0A8B7ZQB1_ACAPL|nr:transmembrane protein 115-like [Acanthaster planci]